METTHQILEADRWKTLGDAQLGAGRWSQALHAYNQAVLLRPDCAEFTFLLGATLHQLGKLDAAVPYYRRALELKPGYAAACSQLAIVLTEQGALDEAILRFQETLRHQPDQAFVYHCLSQFAAEGRYQMTPAEIARMQALANSDLHAASDRSLASFGMGAVLHKQSAYDEAFAYYRRANEFGKRHHETSGRTFDARSHRELVDRITRAHDTSHFRKTRDWGMDTEAPIFIVGMPRSGSTLVEQILASHQNVFGLGEITDVYRFVTQFAANPHAEPYVWPLLSDMRTAKHAAGAFLEWMSKLSQNAGRVTIKTLHNFMHLGLIATLFPRARIVHCRRNTLDGCLSCYFTYMSNAEFTWSLEDIGSYHRSYELLMTHWEQTLPLPIHEVRYEDMIHDQEQTTRRLLDFCDLEWDERCLAFFKTRRAVQTASTIQVRRPVNDKAEGRWKNYRKHLRPLWDALELPSKADISTIVGQSWIAPPLGASPFGTPFSAPPTFAYLSHSG